MILTKIYDKSVNKNLRFGYRFKFSGINFIIYRSAKGRHILTNNDMRELIMLDNCATVLDLRNELISIINKYYSKTKTILKDDKKGIEIVKNKNDYYLNYKGESVLIENDSDLLNFCEGVTV